MVSITIDDRKITVPEGTKVLWAALDNDIYIPNLCAIPEVNEPFAACRLCFVEIEGYAHPVTACTEPVREGMVIYTRTTRALRLARTALELLLANHPIDCAHCGANRSCALQKIAAHLGVKLKTNRFRKLLRELPIDSSSALFLYDPNKCVLCGKCVWSCQQSGSGAIGFAHRGFQRIVTSFGGEPIGQSACGNCHACVEACPVGALVFKEE